MLCTALMLVFAQSAMARAVADVQHMTAHGGEHHHLLFSDVVPDFHHDDDHDHDDAHHPDADEAVGHHGSGHHHHPNDLGSSSLVLVAVPFGSPQSVAMTEVVPSGRLLLGNRQTMLERPPRTGHIGF